MWDTLTAFEREWKATCRAFAAESMAPFVQKYDRENAFPREAHERAYAAGIMNVGFPVELGGQGFSQRALVVGGEELAAVDSPMAFSMGFNHGSLRPILGFGTTEQKQVFIRDLIRRREYASLCMTEPHASGSNVLAIRTRADRTQGGWAITGTKCMTGNGCDASLYLVMANAHEGAERRGLAFFAVPRGPGVRVGPNPDKIGFRCLTTPTITFEDAVVGDEHLIGALGEGERVLLESLDFMRFGGASVILGVVVGALRELLPWLEERTVYPADALIAKSHVQLQLGAIYTELRSVRMMLWRAADLLDSGRRCSLETAMAKLSASELAIKATSAIVQLYGWRGVDNEYPIQKRYRDARVTTIYEGTTEIQLMNVFREMRESLSGDGWL